MFQFPYGNGQQLNLDWFLRKFKELLAEWTAKEASIDGSLQDEIDRAEAALTDVFTARDVTVAAKNDALQAKADALTAAANAAQYWQNAANSAQNAAASAVNALNAANYTAADKATVAADKATVAADKATVAADKAIVAQDKATVAADKAIVAQDKADTDDIKNAANAAGLRAEGWATGTQSGTPVTSDSPYYQNNAKYYSEQTGLANWSLIDIVKQSNELQTGYIDVTGAIQTVSSWRYIDYILITAPTIKIYSTVYGGGGTAFYDKNKNLIYSITGDNASDYGQTANYSAIERTYSVPEGAVYVRACVLTGNYIEYKAENQTLTGLIQYISAALNFTRQTTLGGALGGTLGNLQPIDSIENAERQTDTPETLTE